MKPRSRSIEAIWVGMALDQSDPPVTEAEQICGHLRGGGEVVDSDVERILVEMAHGDGHHRHLGGGELGQDRHRFRQRGRQDDALDLGRGEAPSGLGLLGLLLIFAGLDDEVAAGAPGALQGPDQELAEIGVARVGVEQADMGRLAGGEAARRGVGRIFQPVDRLPDGGASAVPDVLLAVHHPGDGHRRNARGAGHVLDRNAAAAAAARPRHSCPPRPA